MTRFEKFLTALTSFGLFCLMASALILLALLASGCATKSEAHAAEEPLKVIVWATVPGDAWFCMEDPQADGYWDHPQVRHGRIVCPLTVNQLRRAIAQLQATD